MTVTKTHENGGYFRSEFSVQTLFRFTRVGGDPGNPNDVREFDTGLEGILPSLLGNVGLSYWVHQDDGLVTPICGPFQNFVPGVKQLSEDPESGQVSGPVLNICCTQTGHAGPGHLHVIGGANLPTGPNGENHLHITGMGTLGDLTMKVPQLRTVYEKVGLDLGSRESAAGFGFTHDGSVDTLSRFLSLEEFGPRSDQDVADLIAFLLSFSGSDP